MGLSLRCARPRKVGKGVGSKEKGVGRRERTFFISFLVSFFPSFVSSGGAGAAGAEMTDAAAFSTCSTSGSRSLDGPAPRPSGRVMYGAGSEPVSSGGNGLGARHMSLCRSMSFDR